MWICREIIFQAELLLARDPMTREKPRPCPPNKAPASRLSSRTRPRRVVRNITLHSSHQRVPLTFTFVSYHHRLKRLTNLKRDTSFLMNKREESNVSPGSTF